MKLWLRRWVAPRTPTRCGRLQEGGIAIADVDTMSQAIHDVYCGITADHDHPNQKDKDQARAMISAIQRAYS